jgi:hypothetical protein
VEQAGPCIELSYVDAVHGRRRRPLRDCVTGRFEDVAPVRTLRWSRGERHFPGWYWAATTGRDGLVGLADGRSAKQMQAFGQVDPAVVEAMRQAVAETADASSRTIGFTVWRTQQNLSDREETAEVELPSRATLYRLFDRLAASTPTPPGRPAPAQLNGLLRRLVREAEGRDGDQPPACWTRRV